MKRKFAYIVTIVAVLFLNGGTALGQIFVDQAEELGVNSIVSGSIYGSGLSTYDFNQDGLDDISLCTSNGQLKFYQNTGDGFQLVEYGIISTGVAEHLIWVDIDNDNDLDVFFTAEDSSLAIFRNNGDFEFENYTETSGLSTYNANYYGGSFADYDLDGDLDLYVGKYSVVPMNSTDTTKTNKLYQNQGDGTFIDVTVSAEIYKPATYTFQPNWFDYNDDGWPDLHVINDRVFVNFLFRNNGDGTFTDVAEELNVQFYNQDVMSNSITDFDNDGDFDIYMTNTGNIFFNKRNILVVNQGDESFEEQAMEYGLDVQIYSWGALWIDSDNDSWQDLMFVSRNNGFYYFQNNEGESFTQMNDSISISEYSTSYCPARGDFNNDGFSDIAVQSNAPHPPYVLMNQGGQNHFIKTTLSGTISNTQAIGSKIDVYFNESRLTKYTHCGENYLGQDSQHLLFGLGPDASTVDSIVVRYPSRHKDVYYNLIADSSYSFVEGETYEVEISPNVNLSLCNGDSIELDAGIHSAYLWNTGDTTQTIWANNAMSYSVTVTSPLGITAQNTVTINENPDPVISASLQLPTCFGEENGSIELINLTNIPTATVMWNTGADGHSLENISAGTYSYNYTDINGCSVQGSINLLQPAAMEFITSSTPSTQGGADGSIEIFIFGGTPPYEVLMDGTQVGTFINNLPPGEYEFEIIDSNLCTDTFTITVDFTTNLDNHKKIRIQIFPNPTNGELTFRTNETISKIEFINPAGQLLKTVYQPESHSCTITDLPEGTYIVLLTLTNNEVVMYRIVKI